MRPSRNAFLGYSYQEYITFLMLAKMDVEREIKEIEIEAIVDNNFDDIKISIDDSLISCQIKDINNISINDLKITSNHIVINYKEHKLSDEINLLFFKKININVNTHFLGFPAYKISNVYIISLSREEAGTIIKNLYKYNENRVSVIDQFFNIGLDKRKFCVKQRELPTVDIYNINLLEKTINVGKKLLEFENILFIEGKPGVGKSHLVTCLEKEYKNCHIYRFWVSNQDKDYKARLIFQNFLSDLSKKLFRDYRYRSEDEIIEYLSKNNKILIIDGLDHVENYQKDELTNFVNFIDKLKDKCRTIVLSRPLKMKIEWTKQQLLNWNFEETRTVLNELYHFSDYQLCRDIFKITDGYPILVRFVTEHYKQYDEMPLLGCLKGIDDYYAGIISNTNILSALTLFLSTRSFIMESEISLFLKDELLSVIVKEFIKSYPYLFEIRLNRISLFHDSFNTFLRNKGIEHSLISSNVKQIVHKSLMNEEKRFMSRFAFFGLDNSMKIEIIKKYVSIEYFKKTIKTCIDFEALRSFYTQIREALTEFNANEFEIINYYDLSLIINITQRDHISTINEFLYTLVKSLVFHGYSDDDITNSEYLFCMYYYYKTKDATLLHNLTSDSLYNTENFYQILENEVWMEHNYFARHVKPMKNSGLLKKFIDQESIYEIYEFIPHVLANLYLHGTNINTLKRLQNAVKTYLDQDKDFGIILLEQALYYFKNTNSFLAPTYLAKAKDIILSLGYDDFPNEYHTNSLQELILTNSCDGSFNVWPKVLNYIRLSLYEKRKIDLSSVGNFFAMYGKRKDYTVINIDEALNAFEEKGLISIKESIDIIVSTQNMSEKGIRHLLSSYILLHSPEIISSLIKKYQPDSLNITWFDLPPEYINHFPDRLYNYAKNAQLTYSQSKVIDFKDIQNVLESNRKNDLIETLNLFKYRIRITEGHPSVGKLQKLGCSLTMSILDKENDHFKTVEERYFQGIIDSDSIGFIKMKKLKAEDIAGYTDGDYSVFSDLEIFQAYSKEYIKENAQRILRNALIGKIERINMYASLFHFPGNIPKFVNEYDIVIRIEDLYKSFMSFLEVSSLNANLLMNQNE